MKVLRQFISNRGSPHIIFYLGNGKYFTSEDARNFVDSLNIRWKFNIESASCAGRFFERLICSVKWCSRKILGNVRLDYDQMLTIIIEIEVVLNKRAITYSYTESDFN